MPAAERAAIGSLFYLERGDGYFQMLLNQVGFLGEGGIALPYYTNSMACHRAVFN